MPSNITYECWNCGTSYDTTVDEFCPNCSLHEDEDPEQNDPSVDEYGE